MPRRISNRLNMLQDSQRAN